jgi:hypothetical protein
MDDALDRLERVVERLETLAAEYKAARREKAS